MSELLICVAQTDILLGDPKGNLAKAEELLLKATSERSPDLVVFCELFTSGYVFKRLKNLAEPIPGKTTEYLTRIAKKLDTIILMGLLERSEDDGNFYNTLVAVSGSGLVAKYRKMHLIHLMEEPTYLRAGESVETFNIGPFKVGLMICYDLRFPELARRLTLEGVHLIVIPSEWPKPRLQVWRTLLQARAIENQLFVIGCNRIGKDRNNSFFGHSMVIDPWGTILSEGTEEEDLLFVNLDLREIEKSRNFLPCLKDRKNDLLK